MGLRQRSHVARQALEAAAPAVVIVALAGVLALGGETTQEALRFDRAGLEDGELWRAVTGHFVHLGAEHFLLNAAGAVLIALLVAREFGPSQWAVITAASIAGVSLGLWFLNEELAWYVGLSGLLHGWLAAGVAGLFGHRRPDGWALGALLVVKLVIEQWHGALPGSVAATGGPVIVDAHLYGAVAGGLSGIVATRLGRPAGL